MALFFKFMKEGKVNPVFISTEKNSVRYHHFMTFSVYDRNVSYFCGLGLHTLQLSPDVLKCLF